VSSERAFPNSASAVTGARRFVLSKLGAVAPEVSERVAVMVSELATNSLRHAASNFRVTVTRRGDEVTIAVDDDGPGEPRVRSPRRTDPTGRGLRIVQALADAWGVETHGDAGKRVWFTVTAPAPGSSLTDGQRDAATARPPSPPRPRQPGRHSSPPSDELRHAA
jgi:two-component sensor histidine kinase